MSWRTEYAVEHRVEDDWEFEDGPFDSQGREKSTVRYLCQRYPGHEYRIVTRDVTEWEPMDE